MARKRHAESDLKRSGNESDESQDDQVGRTWVPASDEEISQREVVKVSRKRRAAVVGSSFPVFDFAKKATESSPDEKSNEAQAEPNEAQAEPNGSTPAQNENPLLKFLPKTRSWNCKVCLINNDVSKAKCAACETPRPGSSEDKAPSPEKSVSANEFKFGGDSSSTTTFKFGVSSGETITVAPAFSFGSSTPTFGTSNQATPFNFGTSEGDQPASFSALSGESAGASFSFLSSTKSTEAPVATSFQFASKPFEQETTNNAPLAEPVESGEENDHIVLKVPVVAYNLKPIEKETDGKVEKKQQWQECGNGDLHVNTYVAENAGTRSRLVLRMAKTHRLTLNVPLFKGMPLERSNDKMVRLTSVSTEDSQQFKSYLLKTKSKVETDALFKVLTDLTA